MLLQDVNVSPVGRIRPLDRAESTRASRPARAWRHFLNALMRALGAWAV
jgi:hypothetical protein